MQLCCTGDEIAGCVTDQPTAALCRDPGRAADTETGELREDELCNGPTGQTERGSSTHVGVLVRAHPAPIAVPVVLVRLAAPECGSAPCL